MLLLWCRISWKSHKINISKHSKKKKMVISTCCLVSVKVFMNRKQWHHISDMHRLFPTKNTQIYQKKKHSTGFTFLKFDQLFAFFFYHNYVKSMHCSGFSSRECRPSQAFPERGARLPGWRGTQWPFHWYQWHPATEVCHAPTQPQPIWGRARAAVGPGGAEGEKGEGQPTGTCDGKEGRPQDQQRGTFGQLWRPAFP